jgi:hypothetical protein
MSMYSFERFTANGLDHSTPYVIIDPVEPPPPMSSLNLVSAPKLNDVAPQQPLSNTSGINVPWMYNSEPDANGHGLSCSQCYTAFTSFKRSTEQRSTENRSVT